jgi:5'(3')-deoxyribonucleotidase
MPAWLEEIGRDTGVYAKLEDITEWNLCNCPPLNQLTPDQVFAPLQKPGFLRSIAIMPGAREALNAIIAAGHEVYLVTARSGAVSMAETLEWLKDKLPEFPINHLIFCYNKEIIAADVLIDDRPENLRRFHVAHPEARLITISYPYNDKFVPWVTGINVHHVSRGFAPWDGICFYIGSLEPATDKDEMP